MRLIVGLGNPGKKYKGTRHNAGFLAVEELHKQLKHKNISNWKLEEKFNAKIAEVKLDLDKVILAKPMTFMNKSGESIRLIMDYYNKLQSKMLTVIHDDIDLEFGEYRIQKNRSSAGHKGVQSIINHIGTKDFTRVRVGIATEKMDKFGVSDFVLNKFSLLEKRELSQINQEISNEIINNIVSNAS